MKLSINTIKEYTDIAWDTPELVDKLSSRLGGVEDSVDLGKIYGESYVVRVVKATKHPNADKLTVCLVDDAGVKQDAVRNEDGLVEVVCGAPNVVEGMMAVWLPPGATVPSSVESGDPFVLASRPLRGVVSHGMLASVSEMALGDDHTGIIDLSDEDLNPGQSFVEAYGLDDVVIEIENKMFTHRPDLFGQLGIAREVAGIQHKPFTSPGWYTKSADFSESSNLELSISNTAGEKVARFMGVALENVTIKPSPMWLRIYLSKLGVQAVNNVVDITNYVMLTTAQPLHAYDYDKVSGAQLVSRFAEPDEEVALLNGKTYKLSSDDIVIADRDSAVGVAGIMGGAGTEVQEDTEKLIIEVANFDMYAVRKTSMRHGLFTDALTRFNKGQSPLQNEKALALAIGLLEKYAGASVASSVQDVVDSPLSQSDPVEIEVAFINQRLGLDISARQAADLLLNVEFDVAVSGDSLTITPPFWRTDVKIREDIVEEVGRIYGFDRLHAELPLAPTRSVADNKQRQLKQKLRNILSGLGANEVLTYSFVHEKVLKAANQPQGRAFKVTNALSPDLQHYRLTVLPSLLDKVHGNIKAGFGSFILYEFGKGHDIDGSYTEDLPDERQYLDAVYTSTKPQGGAAFYVARSIVDQVSSKLGLDIVVVPVDEDDESLVLMPLHNKRRARVCSVSGQHLGYIGEIASKTRKDFKLPEYTSALSLDLDALEQLMSNQGSRYMPLSRFPSVYRDVSLRTDVSVDTLTIENAARSAIEQALDTGDSRQGVKVSFRTSSVFKQEESSTTRNTTLNFSISPYERTLDGADATRLMDDIASKMCADLPAEVV